MLKYMNNLRKVIKAALGNKDSPMNSLIFMTNIVISKSVTYFLKEYTHMMHVLTVLFTGKNVNVKPNIYLVMHTKNILSEVENFMKLPFILRRRSCWYPNYYLMCETFLFL